MTVNIDQDLWDLTQQYVLDQFAILKRAGIKTAIDQETFKQLVQVIAEPGQAIRAKAGFKYERPERRPDSV